MGQMWILKVSGSGPRLGDISFDLKLGGYYGNALCAAVANGRANIVKSLLMNNVKVEATGRWIKAG